MTTTLTTPTTPAVGDIVTSTRIGPAEILNVRENGALLKARALADSSTWHLVLRNGKWTTL
ncbi:hypothetical protein [Nonomuraea basaltis]|uniref:hypothetical protein n=1 Tax=Nonomuraea basaltis TaxID=2495887 RepID=UPI00110C6F43|nr:hypothetical protein [Nonomuraea basaltis]TMR89490.1 hypothetical protein EJK15_60435 [Nonomuraea basaltis]